jgi:DNA polymerase-1
MTPTRFDAYQLLHRGAIALARAEMVGLRIDLPYMKTQATKLLAEVGGVEGRLKKSKLGLAWAEIHGVKTNFASPTQAIAVLFKHFKLPIVKETEKGNPQVDDEVLSLYQSKVDGIKDLLRLRAVSKTLFTYLAQIERETLDGVLHPFFHLHTVQTYRSSSAGPNFQNMPNRDKEFAEIVRRAILPPPGFHIVEVDYKGLEVSIAAAVTQDPNLKAYVTDKAKDMHRDTAMELFFLSAAQVTKPIRHTAKNGFVFPEFYGSYYEEVAKQIWSMIAGEKLADGTSLRAHLAKNGVRDFGAFQDHVEQIERLFWGRRFPVYAQWRKDQYTLYLKQGYIDTKTGFRCAGLMRRNQVANYPVQGPAFHGLLWSLIETDRVIREKKRRARICGQIHDSQVMIVPPDELTEHLADVEYISCTKLRKAWPWIDVPLAIEIDVAPVGKSWFEKTAWRKEQ